MRDVRVDLENARVLALRSSIFFPPLLRFPGLAAQIVIVYQTIDNIVVCASCQSIIFFDGLGSKAFALLETSLEHGWWLMLFEQSLVQGHV